MATTLPRRLFGAFLLAAALALAPAAAVAAFLALALVSAWIPLLAGAALTTALAVGSLLGRAAFTLFGVTTRRRRATALFAAGLTTCVAVLGSVTVFRPMPAPDAGPVPQGVQYWRTPAGDRLAYVHQRAAGTPRPTPVIFLHGGPGTPGEGVPRAGQALAAAGFDVYAYDQTGSGRSTRLRDVRDYTVARHVADLETVRRAIGAERVILVGQSWGASLAAQYLAAHGNRVARAVFTSPGALWGRTRPGSEAGDPWKRLTPAQRERREELAGEPRILAASLLLRVNPRAAHALVGDREADHWMRETALTGKDGGSCPGAAPAPAHHNPLGFYANQLTSTDFEEIPDPRPALRTAHVPALVLRGDCDYLAPEVAREYVTTLPDTRFVAVEGAGHALPRDRPARYRSLLLDFVTRG
ncbi:alpha/beta fold hydrolase [Streptomyces uncialis]|uniref:alpha/beta fold hydrolase n=1 Tax=Streptomyces uncialis TaxID=1048205 RepID=UPI002E3006C8|nr:alpha/beta fold hydrolase [Streptomyces uncialis]